MKYFLVLLLSLLALNNAISANVNSDLIKKWITQYEEPKNNDWAKFRELKDRIKEIIVEVSKTNGKTKYKTDEEIKSVLVQYSAHLENLKREIPFDYNILSSVNTEQKQNEPKFILTITIDYKDELSQIKWGFNTIFYDTRIEFYSVVDDGQEKTFDQLYNYLTLYEA